MGQRNRNSKATDWTTPKRGGGIPIPPPPAHKGLCYGRPTICNRDEPHSYYNTKRRDVKRRLAVDYQRSVREGRSSHAFGLDGLLHHLYQRVDVHAPRLGAVAQAQIDLPGVHFPIADDEHVGDFL